MKKVTAGNDELGTFAPKFASLNDDVLFGEVWSRKQLSPRDRSFITVTSLISSGILDSSLAFHLNKAKENGITKIEISEALTHLAFYSGWPKVWPAFRMAKDIWRDDEKVQTLFPMGEPNDAYAKYFDGNSYLYRINIEGLSIANVTFEPGCRNHWHIHEATAHGGQMLLVTDGYGWYQEWGKPAQFLKSGDSVYIPAGIKHWHGAAKDSWFTHISIEIPGSDTSVSWLEPVSKEMYDHLQEDGKND